MLRTCAAVLLAIGLLAGAETFEDVQARTDMTNADAVFRLAQWCAENRMPTRAQQLYRQTVTIDKDHVGAQTALGNVLVGDRWVSRRFAPQRQTDAAGGGDGAARRTSGPGPAAKDVAWDLSLPVDPTPGENAFVDGLIERMSRVGNLSDEMGRSVATLIRADNWPTAFPRLCRALLDPGFTDVYGACDILTELLRREDHRAARRLYPFIVKASERVTDAEDLEMFAMASLSIRDRKAVPRLVELLSHTHQGVQSLTREALAAIIRLPQAELTPDKAKAWWDANWSLTEEQVLMAQLRSSDPQMQVEAAAGLCEMRRKELFPVLLRLLRTDDPVVLRRAVMVLRRATTLDWGIEPSLSAEERAKRVVLVERWWRDEQHRFAWPGLPAEGGDGPAAGARAADPDRIAVDALGSTTGNEAQESELRLRSRGPQAVPALLHGLASPQALVRLRAHDILREITRQDFGYDSRGDEAARATAIAAWRAWAVGEGLVESSDDPSLME